MTRHRRNPGMVQHHSDASVGVVLNLPSGYTIKVRPMPPYYTDIIDDAMPLPDYPKREVRLMAGDTVLVEYTPPAEKPDEQSAEYDLYMRWLAIDQRRVEITALRKRARMDYLLSTCVDLQGSGLDDFRAAEWVSRVEASFPHYKMPNHPGKRMLVFLKTFVITSPEWMDLILKTALAEEATMQGIMTALRGFQHQMG